MTLIAVLTPNETWQRRALAFSSAVLALVLVGGYFVPYILLLVPFVAYRAVYHYRALRGRLRIEIHEDKLVCKPAFGRKKTIRKDEIKCFACVFRGDNEVVVARREEVPPPSGDKRQGVIASDVVLPGGLMRNPGLASRLESWRLGTFSADHLFAE